MPFEQKDYDEINVIRPNILLVDDDPQIVYSLSYIFRKKNFNCDKCFNGLDALNMVHSKISSNLDSFYKLIIMDLQMPIMNGMEALKEMNKLLIEHNLTTKIVICSGDEDPKIIREIQDHGGEYAKKPLNIKQINSLISDIEI